MNKRILGIVVILIVAGAGVGFFVFFSGPSLPETIKIGVVTPLTGNAAPGGGIAVRDGVILAAEERETVLGKPIELLIEDMPDAEAGIAAVEKLVTISGVKAIIGSYGTAMAISSSEKAAEYNVVYLETTQWQDSLTNRSYDRYFRICPTASATAYAYVDRIVDFWLDELDETVETLRFAAVYDDWSTYVIDPVIERLEDYGITPVYLSQNPWNIADFTPIVQELKTQDVDILLCEHIVPSATLFRQQMIALDYEPRVTFTQGIGWAQFPFVDALGAENVEGITGQGWTIPTINYTPAIEFAEAFEERFEYPASSVHPLMAYVGAHLLFDAIEEAGVYDEAAIAASLKEIDIATGETAMYWGIKFNERNDNTRCQIMPIFQWQDGEYLCVWPDELSSAEMRRYWAP